MRCPDCNRLYVIARSAAFEGPARYYCPECGRLEPAGVQAGLWIGVVPRIFQLALAGLVFDPAPAELPF